MTRTARAVLGAVVFIAAFGWISAAGAQQAERMNVRGSVEKADGGVPADAPIATCVPGTRDELKPGAKIMIFNAAKQPDGSVQAASVNVGRDGLTPPM